ncbi:MAG: hypothetical protein NUV55_02145 [Sulfuricaulis sp.]|uniref:hypothetical protein n=1 Tax=Sulfuricaulis sp. TaxID=2003553 RepID=UPI0025E9771B|nr:hypothetical protein [Sulfuricaulis sp.]MCR4345996.1 hypothetical protein [Sulfuricaulis sp.]
MKREYSLALILFFSTQTHAEGWDFGEKIAVAPVNESSVFQHLDATGRKSIAMSEKVLAVAWEDNRDGSPQAYVSFKPAGSNVFTSAKRISSGQSAFAPTIVALQEDRFLAAWEQDSAIWARWVTPSGLGPSVKISGSNATQVALATQDGQHIIAAWCQRAGKFNRIVTQELKAGAGEELIRIGKLKPVDVKPPTDDQSYPMVAVTKIGTVIAWEDRRHQHTMLLYSRAATRGNFSEPQVLNEVVKKSDRYGRGNGVMRVALTAYGEDKVAATWMDKRGNQTGYDVYAAFSSDGGWRFGINELVQDSFADQYAQWHPAISGDAAGRVIVAWDDDRDDVSSIWLAWNTGEGWSTNISPPAASGEGVKTSPSITLDAQGNLHLIWLEQGEENGPGRIMYAMGRNRGEPSPPTQQSK